MCDKILREFEENRKKLHDEEYCGTVTKESNLQDNEGYLENSANAWPPQLSSRCPRASIYYACTEDTNPFERINKFIADDEEIAGDHVIRAHFDPPLDPFTIRDPYEESAALEKYLRSAPVCFAIFGKPGLGCEKLAQLLASSWNCVLISPETLIREEIEKNSEKGKWIAESLENGEAIGLSIVTNLVENRVKQRDVMHRGYVVAGFPLIPSNPELGTSTCPGESLEKCCTAETCRDDSEASNLRSESSSSLSSAGKTLSDVMSLRQTKNIDNRLNVLRRTTMNQTLGRGKATAEAHARINPFAIDESLANVSATEKCEEYVPRQVERIFNAWPMKPTIIVYAICPDEDALVRREDFRFDPLKGETVDSRFGENVEDKFGGHHLENYLLSSGNDTPTRAKLQLEIYKQHALPKIDRQVLRHNPQNVIRVDARTSASEMFKIVSARLRTLPLSRAILPKRIWQPEETFEGEGSEKPSENEIGNTTNEEIFEELANKSTISWRFRWSLSRWKYDCPVELAKGRAIEGKAENAVRFMNKIFFLSSSEAVEMFLENPRSFLLPFEPKPSCKVAVFGPKYAGKSELCNALARNFQANVVDVRELEKALIDDRINANVADAARAAVHRVIADVKLRLEAERESRENERREALLFWANEVKTIIEEFDYSETEEEEEEHSKASNLPIVRERLEKLGLHFLSQNLDEFTLERIRKQDESVLYEYAPENLRYEEPPTRELSEHDPEVAAILENEVKHLREEKIVIANSEIAGLLISRIKMMPDEPLDGGLLREPGWVVDGMNPDSEIWAFLAEAGVVFDYIILMMDSEPYDNLIRNWKQIHETESQREQNESDVESDERNIVDSRKTKDLENFISDIKNFEEKWREFAAFLKQVGEQEPFVCNLDETSNVYETVSRHINDRYRLAARSMSEEEREREFEDTIDGSTDIDEEEDLENEQLGESTKSRQVPKDNRRLGDTGIYCPVALARNKVLWKGREEFAALFLDKVYLCSSANALNDFLDNPEAFNVPFKKPMTKIPPARICIVGPPGSGKSSLAEMLSKEYKMTHIDFSSKSDAFMRNLRNDSAAENETRRKMLDECFRNFFKPPHDAFATIFDSFPNSFEEAEFAFKNWAIPELIIELECSVEKTQERLLSKVLDSLRENRQPIENLDEEEEEEEEEEDNSAQDVNEDEAAEDSEEFREQALQQIQETYEQKADFLDAARSRMKEQFIPWINIDGEKNINAVFTSVRKILHPLIVRKSSTLERTREVDPETAENLLESGYYFLSSFGRSCPVQMHQRKIPFQMYLPMAERDEIHTVLHRSYVYFVAGSEALKFFTDDPLKYLQRDSCDPAIPARVSVIGPPKCGKSTLAERFARAYGTKVTTRGDALRWMTEKFAWTRTGSDIENTLRSGDKVSIKLVARAVELYSIDARSSTQGCILDGFPASREEAEELALLNFLPMIFINLQADQNFCLTSSTISSGEENIEKPALYSPNLISHRYEKWEETSASYLDWLTKYAQNVANVDGTGSKWAVWRQANRQVCSRFADIKRYFREADYEKVHSLKNLCVSPYEFRLRQSPCKFYCPSCLHFEDSLNYSGPPPDRRGVVQFREHFYWICAAHLETFSKNPEACLPPQASGVLPAALPQILHEEIDVEHPCWAKRLQADGNCIVTYAESSPQHKILPGQRNLGVLYDDKLYLFCSLDCRAKFLARPSMYSRMEIKKDDEASPPMELKDLPTLDFLKRTVADVIVKAVTKVAAARPKYPGMSPTVSAAVHTAIFLKIHNVDGALNEIDVYEEVARRMEARSRRVPVPDPRYDYLCEYFKPASKVPAFLNVVDIAGLVKGAAEGQGLGNAFLSHISACDAIFHLCRAFEDDDVTHIEGEVNPVRDLDIINEELRLKDIEFLGVHLEKLEKLVVRGNDKKLKPEYDTLLKVKNILTEEKKHIRFADWSVNEIEILNKYLFLTSKPMIYLVNLSEKDYIRKKNKWLIKIKEWVDKNDPGAILIPFSGAFENKVIDMDEAERAKYFEESKVTSALDKIIVQGYKALQLQYFFTSGADEVKAWTIQKGTKAPQAAGRIHTDFEKGFIMAEVMKFEDFKSEGSENGVKAAGKYRQQGRNYVVEDGDIIFFKFNAGAGLKDPKKK